MSTKIRFLLGSCLILLTSTSVLSRTQKFNSAEVLQRYRESLSYLQSVSMKILANVDSNDHELFPQTLDFVFRRDSGNNRSEWLGKQLIFGNEGDVDLNNSTFIKDIADGNKYIYLADDNLIDEGDDSRRVILLHNYEERIKDLLENPNHGGPLFGKMYGSNHKSVANLLGESSDLQIKKENINGMACFVLKGTSKYGKVTAWISPEKGYNAVKWIIEKDPHNLFDNAAIYKKWQRIEGWQALFNVKELHEIIDEDNTVFVPKLAYFTFTISFRDGTNNIDHFEYKTSDIQLKPDFEALGAFKIDLPDGIRVFNKDFPSVRHTWLNGKPVPNFDKYIIKEIDKELDEILVDKIPPASITVKKPEVVTNEPAISGDAQAGAADSQQEILSESRPFPVFVLTSIGLLIIAIIAWRVFLLKGS